MIRLFVLFGSTCADGNLRCRNRTFTLANSCNFTVWPSTRSNMPVANGGFKLNAGENVNVSIPDGWIGSWSPRTGCEFNAAGVGGCEVGDCGGFLACDNDPGIMPANYTTVSRNTYYCLLPGRLRSLTWA